LFPFPHLRGERGTISSGLSHELPPVGSLVYATAGLEVSQDIGQFLVTNAKLTTKLVLAAWSGTEGDEDAFAQGACIVGGVFEDQFESDGSFFGDESQAERRSWDCETMLAGEDEITAPRCRSDGPGSFETGSYELCSAESGNGDSSSCIGQTFFTAKAFNQLAIARQLAP